MQVDIAKAEAKLGGAFALLERAIADAWHEAQSNEPISENARAKLRLACAHATETSADICKTAYTLGGGAAVYSKNSLQRRFRDAHVATQHIATAPAVFELAGRVLLGQDVDTAML